jgi:hypothetical protein
MVCLVVKVVNLVVELGSQMKVLWKSTKEVGILEDVFPLPSKTTSQ